MLHFDEMSHYENRWDANTFESQIWYHHCTTIVISLMTFNTFFAKHTKSWIKLVFSVSFSLGNYRMTEVFAAHSKLSMRSFGPGRAMTFCSASWFYWRILTHTAKQSISFNSQKVRNLEHELEILKNQRRWWKSFQFDENRLIYVD